MTGEEGNSEVDGSSNGVEKCACGCILLALISSGSRLLLFSNLIWIISLQDIP